VPLTIAVGASHFCKLVVGASRSLLDPAGSETLPLQFFFASLRCSLSQSYLSYKYHGSQKPGFFSSVKLSVSAIPETRFLPLQNLFLQTIKNKFLLQITNTLFLPSNNPFTISFRNFRNRRRNIT
jgi:hypothetical protein